MSISKLKKEVYELIAAGEVIERPASIVKELVENSIDAGATSIDIEIKGGGKKLIRVTDNGCGVKKEDFSLAFVSHATSKISTKDDLLNIRSLGFRGEALASIAAISKVSMLSKTKDSETGIKYRIEASCEISKEICGCAKGTTIVVEELFYNTPARLKFLKKDSTETSYIEDIVSNLALSHPEISFTLKKENAISLETPGNNKLIDAIYSVYGMDFTKSLIKCSINSNGISVKGYITIPMQSKNNRKMQTFFVNNRYIKSKLLSNGLEEGYKGSIMISKFPGCVLFIEVPKDQIDINVHPSKTEVKFSDESSILETIYNAVRKSIAEYNVLPKADVKKHVKKNNFDTQHSIGSQQSIKTTNNFLNNNLGRNLSKLMVASEDLKYNPYPQVNHSNKNTTKPSQDTNISQRIIKEDIKATKETISFTEQTDKNEIEDNELKDKPFKVIGEVFATYILAQIGDYFAIIDKHAAHERIIYEQLKKDDSPLQSQLLVEPVVINLTSNEKDAVLNNQEVFEKFGFYVEDFGRGSMIIREIPSILSKKDFKVAFSEIVDNLINKSIKNSPKTLENIYHTMACRAAIKANDINSEIEIKKLFEQVYHDENIRNCPHGRPVIIIYKKRDFEKRFGREQ